jgi:Tfp pilus assembly protein PilX
VRRGGHRRSERGSALVALSVAVILCGTLSATVLVSNSSRQRYATTLLERERAFQLAEAGVDWAISRLRCNNGALPSNPVETRDFAKAGSFSVRYLSGTANGTDDDGDGTTDEADEGSFSTVRATGTSGTCRRTVEILTRRIVDVPTFNAAVQMNVDSPVFDLTGAAFRISGENHAPDGSLDPSQPTFAAIASPATVASVTSQIDPKWSDQITGAGGTPSVRQVAALDLTRFIEQARTTADSIISAGTYSGLTVGTPTYEGVRVVYATGDVKLTGTGTGAGVLAVNGDLEISGDFTWVGIILVRGRVRMMGGGGTQKVIGVLTVADEVTTTNEGIGLNGTVDLLYSQQSIVMAAGRLATTAVASWREVGNP